MKQHIGIIGAGAWGTALAQNMANAGKQVTLWARESEVVRNITDKRENHLFLPGIRLHEDIQPVESIAAACEADVMLVVTPAQAVRSVLSAMRPSLNAEKAVLICAKGIELETGLLLSHVAEETVPETSPGILTGPTFAREIAEGRPCAVTLAINDRDKGADLVEALGSRYFRPYFTQDIIGAQIGGAIKNVYAIACGAVIGRELGESARAGLMTRGLAEMSRLTAILGGDRMTLQGMSGVGDLTLTCTSEQSRNYSLGLALGRGESLENILKTRTAVTEGVSTAKAVVQMARKQAVDMPICAAVQRFLEQESDLDTVIGELLDRPLDMPNSARMI